jgi:hypothetical protein
MRSPRAGRHYVSPVCQQNAPSPDGFSPQSSTTIGGMKTLAIISILALLTISGAAYTDQLLTSGHQSTQRVN